MPKSYSRQSPAAVSKFLGARWDGPIERINRPKFSQGPGQETASLCALCVLCGSKFFNHKGHKEHIGQRSWPAKAFANRGYLVFDVHDPTEVFITIEFRLRSVRLAMLIDAYRQQVGAFPDSLDVLNPVAVAAIGGDPYVDGPLGYRVVEGGFLVYSVGPDLVDDGAEYKGYVMGDLVERFEKEKPVVIAEAPERRGRDSGGLTRPRAR